MNKISLTATMFTLFAIAVKDSEHYASLLVGITVLIWVLSLMHGKRSYVFAAAKRESLVNLTKGAIMMDRLTYPDDPRPLQDPEMRKEIILAPVGNEIWRAERFKAEVAEVLWRYVHTDGSVSIYHTLLSEFLSFLERIGGTSQPSFNMTDARGNPMESGLYMLRECFIIDNRVHMVVGLWDTSQDQPVEKPEKYVHRFLKFRGENIQRVGEYEWKVLNSKKDMIEYDPMLQEGVA